MANPQINLGNLNKIRASVIVTDFQALNVTAPYLGKNGVSVNYSSDAAAYIQTMAGAVPSPEPYLLVAVTMDVLKTTGTYQRYKNQIKNLSLIGEIRVIPDNIATDDITISNCVITNIGELPFNGTAAECRITVMGVEYINQDLFTI